MRTQLSNPNRTSFPPRISSYHRYANQLDAYYTDTAVNVEDGSSGTTTSSSNDKCSKCICRFIHLLSNIINFSFVPLVVMMAVLKYGSMIASQIGLGLIILKILVPKNVSRRKSMMIWIQNGWLWWWYMISFCCTWLLTNKKHIPCSPKYLSL